MSSQLQIADEATTPSSTQPKRSQHDYARFNRRSSGNAARFGGIHMRRDKRFPLSNRARFGTTPPPAAAPAPTPPARVDDLKSWQEAVMLWLSWNRDQEKLTAKMCRPGCDQQKLEALMDEMDQLRQRAIDLSEQLVRQ